jgi:hypothetical protein
MGIAGATLWMPAWNNVKLFPQNRLGKTMPRRRFACIG